MDDDQLNERVLTVHQRKVRALSMRRNARKLARAKHIAKRRLAPEKNINKRAFAKARQLIRKRVAGMRGLHYAMLGDSEKIQIDRLVEKKQKLIKKLAVRLIPRIRRAEQNRLQSFLKGSPLKNLGAPEAGKTMATESLNELFESNDLIRSIALRNRYEARPFIEEEANDSRVYNSLVTKSTKAGVSLDVLGEVYDRGIQTWTPETGKTPQQYAFNRVNSFCSQGKTYFNEDVDLREARPGGEGFKNWMFEFKKGDKTKVLHGPYRGTRGIVVAKHDGGAVYSIMHPNGTVMKHHISTLEEPIIEEGRSPGKPRVKRYTNPDGTTALKSLTKWGKRKDWRDSEGGREKAMKHAGVDKIDEGKLSESIDFDKAFDMLDAHGAVNPRSHSNGIYYNHKGKEYNLRSYFKKSGHRSVRTAELEHHLKRLREDINDLSEKKLTPAELNKREEIVLAMKDDNPNMPKSKLYAIATATAKRVAESKNLPWREDPKNPSHKVGVHKDEFGNIIKNMPKHLARKAMKANEEVAVGEDTEQLNEFYSNMNPMRLATHIKMLQQKLAQMPADHPQKQQLEYHLSQARQMLLRKAKNTFKEAYQKCDQCDGKCKCDTKEGNSQNDPEQRLIGTDSLVDALKTDTPGQHNEQLNNKFTAAFNETVVPADKVPEVVRAYTKVNPDGSTTTVRARVRRQTRKQPIINSGNTSDGQ